MQFIYNFMLILAMLTGMAGCCSKEKYDSKTCVFLFVISAMLGFLAAYTQ